VRPSFRGGGSWRLLPAENVSLDRVDEALTRLEGAAPAVRKQVLEAAGAVVMADGRVELQEAEMLRAVAEALEVPIPLLLPSPLPSPEAAMDGSEVIAFLFSLLLAAAGVAATRKGSLHPLYFRGNPGPGIVRLAVILSMLWIGLVIAVWADESVAGIYVVFYLVMGYAAVKFLGQTVVSAYGARSRVDVAERRNVPAALVVAAFTLATGLIFGGSLWGDADPVGDDEGGWWIVVGFFLMGWASLLVAFGLFLRREAGRIATRLQRERSLQDARTAAVFLLSAAVVLTDAVSGDFWGWRHGILTFGVLAGMLITHQVFAGLALGKGAAHGARGGGVAVHGEAGREMVPGRAGPGPKGGCRRSGPGCDGRGGSWRGWPTPSWPSWPGGPTGSWTGPGARVDAKPALGLSEAERHEVYRALRFRHFKWDTFTAGRLTLLPETLVIPESLHQEVVKAVESLHQGLLLFESRVRREPEALERLGIPQGPAPSHRRGW
jgi:hypothetical protein